MTQPKEPNFDAQMRAIAENIHLITQRPEGHLQDFPIPMRWEVTRRHPYYLAFWQEAKLHRQGEMGKCPEEYFIQQTASLILGAIGVTGMPVDPSVPFEEWNNMELDPAFLSGALQPMTCRQTAVMLINALSRAELQALGALFMTAGSDEYAVDGDDNARSLQKKAAMERLAIIPSVKLDSYPAAPLFYIHMGASQRTILEDVKSQIHQWKEQLEIQERRVPVKKLQSYLEIWDLFEGWTGSNYDWQQERSLKQIAQQKKESLSTIFNKYRAAFEMIIGHSFSKELWTRLFFNYKLSEHFQPNKASEGNRRKLSRRYSSNREQHRPVPDSVVSPAPKESEDGSENGSVVNQESFIMGDFEQSELAMDVETLSSRGLSTQAIAEELECNVDFVNYICERLGEFPPEISRS